ncbi:MAG TPA: aromatic amino acid DMT transporter YddG [Brachybacterium sp.]|nr:aromatic amino acid DMT transporter YddG [Brachybacterium sp.]
MTTSRTPSRPSVVQRAPEGALRAPGGRQAGAFPARRATLAGLGAIVVWSAMVALLRLVSDDFGATLGMALVYSLAAAMLWIVRRPRALRSFPLRYLLVGGALFVTTDVCAGLAVGLAADANQAVEVSIVHYLWPTLTVVQATLVSRRPGAFRLVLPGALLAMAGIVFAVSGQVGLDVASIVHNVAEHPLPYGLALTAALAWSTYNVFSPALARGRDGITVFFTGVGIALWVIHLASGAPTPAHVPWTGYLALVAAAGAVAAGYALWNIGILGGDMRLLGSASYTTPLLSSAVAAILLGTTLGLPFWLGVVLVVIGSLLSWWAGRERRTGRGAVQAAAAEHAVAPAPSTREDGLRDEPQEG